MKGHRLFRFWIQQAVSLFFLLLIPMLPVSAQENASFLEVAVDNPAPYVGQPIIYILRFYDALPEQQKQYFPPAFNGFGQETFAEIAPTIAQVNGRQYTVYTLETLLFPLREGTQTIDAYRVVYPETGVVLTSEVLTTNVQTLPENAPDSFINAIGQFDAQAFLSAATANTGDALMYTLEITGTGNTANITVADPDFSSAWQVFAGDTKYAESTRNFGTKTFSWSLIPQQPGTLILPPLEFSFFDPQTGTYTTRTTGSFQVVVTGEVRVPEVTPESVDNTSTRRELSVRMNFVMDASPVPAPGFWLLWLIAPAFTGISWFLIRSRNSERVLSPQRRGGSALQSALRDLKKLQDDSPETIFTAIPPIILSYLQRKTGKNITSENISEHLPDLPEKMQKRLIYCMGTAESGRYAPVTEADAQQLLRQVAATLKQVEQSGVL